MGVFDPLEPLRFGVAGGNLDAQIRLDGRAANEQLDLTISPESKGVRLFSLRSPLYVRGPFLKPDAGVKAVPLMLRGTADTLRFVYPQHYWVVRCQ